MKYKVRKLGKAIKKTAALVLYVILSVIAYLFDLISIVYRFFSVPLAAMILLVAVVSIVSSGFDTDFIPWIAGSFIAILIRFILPILSTGLHKMKDAAEKTYRTTVISVKSPVQYTI